MFRSGYLEGLRLRATEVLIDPLLNHDFRQLSAQALLAQVNPKQIASIEFRFGRYRIADEAYYLQFAGSQLLRGSYIAEGERLLERAANFFEYLSIISPPESSDLNEYLLRAAGCYSLAGYQAN